MMENNYEVNRSATSTISRSWPKTSHTKSSALLISVLLCLILAAAASAQPAPMIVQMELQVSWSQGAKASFEMGRDKISDEVRNLNIHANRVSFLSSFQGAELQFSGTLMDREMSGSLDVVEKGKKVATGTWKLTRSTAVETKGLSETWRGSFSVLQIPAQRPDPDFDVRVSRPTYRSKHPKVLFDEAHNNVHTASGLYRPFVDLITNDGYIVVPNKDKFVAKTLSGFDVLVIVNAAGPRGQRANPAFTEEECDAVRDWVRSGGNLLFIADHEPMGAAAEILAKRFGVEMSKAFTDYPSSKDRVLGDIIFSRKNKLLVDSSITRGRDQSELINSVVTFTGQSLKGGTGSKALLKLPDTAVDTYSQPKKSVSAAGRTQGLTMSFGKGRVVVLGEAAMLTAQIDDEGRIFGMNYPDNDNKQFALNLMHWLSRILK